jgi:hypothetical protein
LLTSWFFLLPRTTPTVPIIRVLRINDLHPIDRKAPQRQATFQLDFTVRGMVIPAMNTATTVPPITMARAYPVRNGHTGA